MNSVIAKLLGLVDRAPGRFAEALLETSMDFGSVRLELRHGLCQGSDVGANSCQLLGHIFVGTGGHDGTPWYFPFGGLRSINFGSAPQIAASLADARDGPM